MNKEEIKGLVNKVSDFENSIRKRVDDILEIKRVKGCSFDRVEWDECDDANFYVRVSDRWDSWMECYPIEYLADDFDIEQYRKDINESIKETERLNKEAQEKKEREEYERLKAKFEKPVAPTPET